METTDPIIERGGAPVILASIEPPDTGRRAAIWYATVRFARTRGTPRECELLVIAEAIREGSLVRLLRSTDTHIAFGPKSPERAWVAVVGTKLCVMAGTTGPALRARLISFAIRDKIAMRAAVRAENQQEWAERNEQLRALRDLANYSNDADERARARLQLEKERTR